MLETGLTLNGFRVTSARTGREAMEAAAAGAFDAVLSDIYMPDGGGLELVDRLRAADPALPIVLMTAKASVQVPPWPDDPEGLAARDSGPATNAEPFRLRQFLLFVSGDCHTDNWVSR